MARCELPIVELGALKKILHIVYSCSVINRMLILYLNNSVYAISVLLLLPNNLKTSIMQYFTNRECAQPVKKQHVQDVSCFGGGHISGGGNDIDVDYLMY